MITREDMPVLLGVAEWTMQSRRHVMNTIRELAGTEERYLILARELDRVKAHVAHARSLRAEATLTLVQWLVMVDSSHWKCAYCQEQSFEVMYHPIPLHEGGTTATNCLPACRRCRTRNKKHAPDQALLVTAQSFIQCNSPLIC